MDVDVNTEGFSNQLYSLPVQKTVKDSGRIFQNT
jgi:hypothetical protein